MTRNEILWEERERVLSLIRAAAKRIYDSKGRVWRVELEALENAVWKGEQTLPYMTPDCCGEGI